MARGVVLKVQSSGRVQGARAPLALVVARRKMPERKPLGNVLVEMGALAAEDLMRVLERHARQSGFLGDVLLMLGLVSEEVLIDALAQQYGTDYLTRKSPGRDPALMDQLGVQTCLAYQCLPWARAGDVTLVATARPNEFEHHRARLEACFGAVAMVLISESDLQAIILKARRTRLKLWAETCVDESESCRVMRARGFGQLLLGGGLAVLMAAFLAPLTVLMTLTLVTTILLALTSLLKLAAAIAVARKPSARAGPAAQQPSVLQQRKPIVSILVPLHNEPRVVPRLINRLSRVTWPREVLDILLVVEEKDKATRAALDAVALPRWMRVIAVPDAPLKTKPRALNYAMLFARGSIIGVYDAEDAPAPDQIHQVVRCFQNGSPRLACVQGVLDFYNARVNWLSRCFTIEYAIWFRIVLPGMQRLGLAVPLGGTTLFFRRDVLERLGGWDAHNVTEDADLGIRLARHGYYTQLLDTVTQEEATCRAVPWIKQRSRWLKGYAVTWLVHMRAPRLLWRQLGTWRFLGVQLLFLGTLVQFMFAPLLWSFWLFFFGFGHPLADSLERGAIIGFTLVFLCSEVITFTLGYVALKSRTHRSLRFWLPAMHAYFPLAVLARIIHEKAAEVA